MQKPLVTSQHDSTDSNARVPSIHSLISEQSKILLNQIPNFAFILCKENIYINQELQHYLNPSKTNLELEDILNAIHPSELENFTQLINAQDIHLSTNTIQQQYRIKNHLNEYHCFLLSAKANIHDTQTIEWFISLIDLQQYNQSHKKTLLTPNKSEIDDLTGLLNRDGLKNSVQQLLKSKTKYQNISLYLIGLDYFKNINDTQGYAAGDFVLKSFASRLKNEFQDSSLIARLGSDEFAVVYYDIQNIDTVEIIGKKILNLMLESYDYNGKILNSSMSIGCAVYPQDANNFSHLLQCADTALNDLKARGRGGIQFFNENMFNAIRNKAIQIETARRILHEKTISPYYQPKVELSTGKTIGLEALLRWRCTETNTIYTPDTITEAFDDFMLSTKISTEMQSKIFADIKKWQIAGKKIIPVAINASPVEFFRDNYAETLLQRIQDANISPEHIEIEITEHLFSKRGVEYVIRAVNKLQEAGIKISLDDFGTGHSSLTHLRDLPVNSIKIDYSFIEKITEEKTIAAIVEGIVKLGPLLNMNVIAEGIENQQQLDLLIKMGCPQGQGFLFRDAVTAQEVENLLDK